MNVIQMSDFLELFQTLTLILGALQGLQIAMQQLSAFWMARHAIDPQWIFYHQEFKWTFTLFLWVL